MILRAELLNALPSRDLEQTREGSCTYCCTPVEISTQLANLIIAWPDLSERQREAFSLMATSQIQQGSKPKRKDSVHSM